LFIFSNIGFDLNGFSITFSWVKFTFSKSNYNEAR